MLASCGRKLDGIASKSTSGELSFSANELTSGILLEGIGLMCSWRTAGLDLVEEDISPPEAAEVGTNGLLYTLRLDGVINR